MDSIVEIVKAKIDKPEISTAYLNNESVKDEFVAGATSPLIQMGDHYWKGEMIESFELTYGAEEFLPKVSFKIRDKSDIISTSIVNDIEVADIWIRSDNVDFKSIKATFLIIGYEQSKSGSYEFWGELFIKDMDMVATKSYTGSSFDVIKEVAKELKLGFASNILGTNDTQNWLKVHQAHVDFFEEVRRSSWADDNSTMNLWVDPWYNVNLFNIYESYKQEQSDFRKVAETNLAKNYTQEKDPLVRDFYISDHQSKIGTPNFLNAYFPMDSRGDVEKDIGYERIISVEDVDALEYEEYLIQHNIDSVAITRSGNNTRSSYTGFISENTHRNNSHAKIQNGVNDAIYKSKGIRFQLKQVNPVMYAVIRVPLLIINDSMNNADFQGDEGKSLLNESLSGEYIIYKVKLSYKQREMSSEYVGLFVRG